MKKISLDVLFLLILVIARVRIDTLVDALVAPRPFEKIQSLPIFGSLLPPERLRLMKDWMTDPYSLLLITFTFGLLAAYVVLDEILSQVRKPTGGSAYTFKLALIFAIVLTTVFAQSFYLILMRHATGPASYTHDGGVIQTEEAIKFFLVGKNPYVEDYTNTPMAEWGLDYRTALYHYPYLPWTFLFSAPFYMLGQAVLGWYDQRFIYLALFLITLFLASRLSKEGTASLCLSMILGLNPIMGNDIIYGQNDSFVLFWIVLAVYLLQRRRVALSSAALGLACASKPTAWLLAPFYFLYLFHLWQQERERPFSAAFWKHFLPGVAVFGIIVLPFALWNLDAMVDDIWRWSAGTADVPYQIRGWGLANLILALGLVESRLSYFPFWIFELFLAGPFLLFLLWRQSRANTMGTALQGYAAFSLVFFYLSRFLNENYLGYILACFAVGYFIEHLGMKREVEETH